jgi:hypothetical protein
MKGARAVEQKGWRLAVKKTFDRTIAAGALVALAPVLGATAIGVRRWGARYSSARSARGSGRARFRSSNSERCAMREIATDVSYLTASA